MLYCPYCGAQNDDGSKFCAKCGKPLEPAPAVPDSSPDISGNREDGPSVIQDTVSNAETAHAGSGKKAPVKLIAAVGVAAALIAVIAGVSAATSAHTVNLNDYVTIEVDGYDGYGTAKADFDVDKFINENDEDIQYTKAFKSMIYEESKDEFGESADPDQIVEMLCGKSAAGYLATELEPKGALDADKDLSNGDTVTYSWDLNDQDVEEVKKYMNVKISFDDIATTVEGLEKVKTFDPFDDVNVSFSGVAPAGKAAYSTSSPLQFTFSSSSNLSNGDKVTLSLSTGVNDGEIDSSYFMDKFGAIPSAVSKEYEVSGLSSYITKVSDIPDDLLKKMQAQAKDVMDTYVARNWTDDVKEENGKTTAYLHQTLKDFQYIGCYDLAAKEPSSWPGNNCIYLVYKVTGDIDQFVADGLFFNIFDSGRITGQVKYYTTFCFKDAMLDDSGKATVDLSDCEMAYDTAFDYAPSKQLSYYYAVSSSNYRGYTDLVTFENKAIAANADNYTSDNNIDQSLLFDESEIGFTETTAEEADQGTNTK